MEIPLISSYADQITQWDLKTGGNGTISSSKEFKGKMTLSTENGDVFVQSVKSPQLSVHSGAGHIQIQTFKVSDNSSEGGKAEPSSFQVRTTAGNIALTNSTLPENSKISSSARDGIIRINNSQFKTSENSPVVLQKSQGGSIEINQLSGHTVVELSDSANLSAEKLASGFLKVLADSGNVTVANCGSDVRTLSLSQIQPTSWFSFRSSPGVSVFKGIHESTEVTISYGARTFQRIGFQPIAFQHSFFSSVQLGTNFVADDELRSFGEHWLGRKLTETGRTVQKGFTYLGFGSAAVGATVVYNYPQETLQIMKGLAQRLLEKFAAKNSK